MIEKGAEPRSLTHHRAQAHSDYDNFVQKDDLRAALVSEQKGLCCYCTGRVRAESAAMKIEHWKCQTNHPNQQLIYGNLLGACLGGEGKPPPEQHCDTKKANRSLKWNPAETAHAIETKIKYLVDGTIVSPDVDFNMQLNDVLGLNFSFLKSSRKAVLDAVLQWWRSTPNARQKVQQQISFRIKAVEYQPFSPIAIWFLRQKL